ncbi:MAG: hypothetical protein SFX73_15070 [Kofleriaceae bacterium]|nr:hypothetical protein [Kofleriaceae bacterium]
MPGDSQREHAPVASGPTAKPEVAPTKAKQPTPTPSHVDKLAGAAPMPSPRFAYAPKIDLGDVVVGDRSTHETSVYALDATGQGPRVDATVSGDPAFSLSRAPLFLPAIGGTFDPSYGFKLDFRPTRAGTFEGTLTVHVLDATNETFHIPLRAGAHAPGGRTRTEQAVARTTSEAKNVQELLRHAHDAETDATIAAEWTQMEPYPSGAKAKLDSLRIDALAALGTLDIKQQGGIAVASEEIGKFQRKPPAGNDSLLEQLAFAALDLATASIAGAVAGRLKGLVKIAATPNVSAQVPHPMLPQRRAKPEGKPIEADEGIIGLFTDGMKHLVKASGTHAKHALKGSPSTASAAWSSEVDTSAELGTYAKFSADPTAQFIAIQTDGLADLSHGRKTRSAVRAYDALLPMLRTRPEHAIASMQAIVTALSEAASDVTQTQAEQSVRHWVRYLQASSPGTANRPFSQEAPMDKIDGMIDVRLSADARPAEPVQAVGARLFGVRKAVVERLAKHSMRDLGLTVRAHSNLRSPSASITVVRAPDGTIEFSENPTPESHTQGWFARRAEAFGAGRDAPRGARMLIEEILPKSLGEVAHGASNIENDSVD